MNRFIETPFRNGHSIRLALVCRSILTNELDVIETGSVNG
jgi:hypothetical protein